MSKVVELLRDQACYYLEHTCETINKSLIHVPSPDTIDKIWIDSDRNIRVLNNLQWALPTITQPNNDNILSWFAVIISQ